MSRKMLTISAVLLALMIAVPLSAQDFDYKGFIDTYQAARIHDPYDFLSSRTRLRLESWFSAGDATAFVSFNAIHNNVIEESTGFEIREAYIDYVTDNWDLRVGRQIIVWGKADGLAITDIISPWDYTEFLAQDFDDLRIPVDAVKWRLLFNEADLEVVWLPKFQPAILAPPGTPWEFKTQFPKDITISFNETEKPDFNLKNGEFGAKLSFYLPWADFSLSAFYTYDDLPTMHRMVTKSGDQTSVLLQPKYHRSTFVGAAFSVPYGALVFRGESAFYFDKRFEPQDFLSEQIFESNFLRSMLGVDITPGNDWTISIQLMDDFIVDFNPEINGDEHSVLATLSISKKLFRQTLELGTFSFVGVNDANTFTRGYADYSLTDDLHLLFGLDVFTGDKGLLGQFNANDELWFKMKFSF